MPENINKIEESLSQTENAGAAGCVKAELPTDADLTSLTEVGERLVHDEPITADGFAKVKESLEKAKEQAKVDIGGREISMAEYQKLVEQNRPIWEEIKRGKYENHERLTFLIPSVAAELAKYQCNYLSLSSLTTLTPEVAAELVKFQGQELDLSGLTRLTPKIAVELVKYKGLYLDLNGLTTLTPEVATHLVKFKCNLYFSSFDQPSRDLFDQARAAYKAEQEENKK